MTRKRSLKVTERDTKVEQAIAALSRGEFANVNQAARHFKLHYTTLKRRLEGGKSIAESREASQLLTIPEEHAVVRWIRRLAASGYHVTHRLIQEIAEEIRQRRLIGINEPNVQYVEYEPIGDRWTQRFLERHAHLKTAIAHSIELARVTEASPEVIERWFNVLFRTIDELGILLKNIYNCDETGFALGKGKAMQVVIDTEVGQKYEAEPGRQEWITVMECICADGSSITPMIIFKGENISKSWIPVEQLKAIHAEGWHVSCNKKGWTSNGHGIEWLKKSFEPATREKANSQFRLLICDGHDSHISADFIRHCIANRIVLLLLPPHCSHLMQPLDVGVFRSLKQATRLALKQFYHTGIARLQKAEWFDCFIKARQTALTVKNIKAGWKGAGIYPMDPSKVINKIPRPETTSLISSTDDTSITPTEIISAEELFDILEDMNALIDARALHSATTALNDLVRTKQALHTPARKFIPRLASTTESLLAENAILKLELKQCKDVLGSRKVRQGGKRLVLKGKIIISTEEILKLIEEAEAVTQNKRKTTGRPRGRPRKNAPIVPIVTLEEAESGDDEGSQSEADV